ncbi:hypothetical protein pb186bvf_003701 [Paramecium bursaria]
MDQTGQVQDILDRRFNKETNQVEYLVQWDEATNRKNSWETISKLDKPMMNIAKDIERVLRPVYKKGIKEALQKEILKFIDIQVISGQHVEEINMKDKFLKNQSKIIFKFQQVTQAQNKVITNNDEIIISDDEEEKKENQSEGSQILE